VHESQLRTADRTPTSQTGDRVEGHVNR